MICSELPWPEACRPLSLLTAVVETLESCGWKYRRVSFTLNVASLWTPSCCHTFCFCSLYFLIAVGNYKLIIIACVQRELVNWELAARPPPRQIKGFKPKKSHFKWNGVYFFDIILNSFGDTSSYLMFLVLISVQKNNGNEIYNKSWHQQAVFVTVCWLTFRD